MWAPNWGRLFAEWRCKAIWVPFSDKEWEAIKTWVNPKSIQTWEIKIDEVIEVKETTKETSDDKEMKKQLRQTLRDRGISFTNFESVEKLQEKLQANL